MGHTKPETARIMLKQVLDSNLLHLHLVHELPGRAGCARQVGHARCHHARLHAGSHRHVHAMRTHQCLKCCITASSLPTLASCPRGWVYPRHPFQVQSVFLRACRKPTLTTTADQGCRSEHAPHLHTLACLLRAVADRTAAHLQVAGHIFPG